MYKYSFLVSLIVLLFSPVALSEIKRCYYGLSFFGWLGVIIVPLVTLLFITYPLINRSKMHQKRGNWVALCIAQILIIPLFFSLKQYSFGATIFFFPRTFWLFLTLPFLVYFFIWRKELKLVLSAGTLTIVLVLNFSPNFIWQDYPLYTVSANCSKSYKPENEARGKLYQIASQYSYLIRRLEKYPAREGKELSYFYKTANKRVISNEKARLKKIGRGGGFSVGFLSEGSKVFKEYLYMPKNTMYLQSEKLVREIAKVACSECVINKNEIKAYSIGVVENDQDTPELLMGTIDQNRNFKFRNLGAFSSFLKMNNLDHLYHPYSTSALVLKRLLDHRISILLTLAYLLLLFLIKRRSRNEN